MGLCPVWPDEVLQYGSYRKVARVFRALCFYGGSNKRSRVEGLGG